VSNPISRISLAWVAPTRWARAPLTPTTSAAAVGGVGQSAVVEVGQATVGEVGRTTSEVGLVDRPCKLRSFPRRWALVEAAAAAGEAAGRDTMAKQ